tara:strand:+ start:4115 stop:4627 length:513 start_codon:yes stop_codon:yes gene_type:complete
MKTIKIILGVITFFVVAFFLTGLFVKETTYQVTVTLNKPVSEVFARFNDPRNSKDWIPEIKSIVALNENLGKVGSTYQIVIENKGQEITMTQKVIAFVPNEKVTFYFDAESMLKTDDYVFTEKLGVTTIQLSAICVSDSYIMACMFPYFKGTFKAQDQGYLNRFKAFLEK